MRILFVHNPPDLYGASRCLLRLSARMVAEGHAVKVVMPCDGALSEKLAIAGVGAIIDPNLAFVSRQNLHSASDVVRFFRSLFPSIRFIQRIAREFKPDVIHTNTSLIVSPGPAARLCGIPHVWHIREVFSDFPVLWRFYQLYLDIWADAIICVSDPVSRQFSAWISHNKLITIRDGLPRDEFVMPSAERICSFRKRFNLDGGLVVGTVGRINLRRKGQGILARAASILKNEFPQVKYICVGAPFPGNERYSMELQDLVHELGLEGRFLVLGEVEDMPAAYASMDINVLPALLPEAFSGTAIETMAMGKPFVGSRLGGMPEQVVEGVTGFLVEPGDPDSLAQALRKLLQDRELRQKLGQNGRSRFLELFEFERSYEHLLQTYHRVINV